VLKLAVFPDLRLLLDSAPDPELGKRGRKGGVGYGERAAS